MIASDNQHRIKVFSVSEEVLLRLLSCGAPDAVTRDIPADASIVHIWRSDEHPQCFNIAMRSAAFDVVPEGVAPPVDTIRYRKRDDAV